MDWEKYDNDKLTIKKQYHDKYGFLLNSPFATRDIICEVGTWMKKNLIYLNEYEKEISNALLIFWSPVGYHFEEGMIMLKRFFENEKEEVMTETEVLKTALFNSLVTHLIFRGIIKL